MFCTYSALFAVIFFMDLELIREATRLLKILFSSTDFASGMKPVFLLKIGKIYGSIWPYTTCFFTANSSARLLDVMSHTNERNLLRL